MTTVRKTKLAGELVGGDWLAADEHYPTPVRVLAVHTYLDHGSPSALITAVGPNNMPFSFDRFADASFSLATEPEIAATTSRGHRQQIVTELLLLAEILGQAPAPVERTVLIQLHAASRAEVRAIGAHLGIEPEKRYRDGLQVTWPKGRQAYDDGVCVLWYTDKAEDDEPERCETCGESLREIERGTLGHIPGEACAPIAVPTGDGYSDLADRLSTDVQPVPPYVGGNPMTGRGLVEEGGWLDDATGLVSGGLVPNCPTCGGQHHTIEPCR